MWEDAHVKMHMRRCMCVECDVQDRDDALVSSGKPGAWANDHVDGSLE